MVFMIGTWGTINFFFKAEKIKSSLVFFLGFFIIAFIKIATIGGLMQLYSLFMLFKSFFPTLFSSMYSLPYVGVFLKNNRFFNSMYEKIGGNKNYT